MKDTTMLRIFVTSGTSFTGPDLELFPPMLGSRTTLEEYAYDKASFWRSDPDGANDLLGTPVERRGETIDVREWVARSLVERAADFSEPASRLTAELASLRKILENEKVSPANVRILFLHSQTREGTLGASLAARATLAAWPGCDVSLREIVGLDAKNRDRFLSHAAPSLVGVVREEVESTGRWKDAPIVFNVTGGYKGLIPFVALIAFKIGAQVSYLFEESNETIDLPPVRITATQKQPLPSMMRPFFDALADLR